MKIPMRVFARLDCVGHDREPMITSLYSGLMSDGFTIVNVVTRGSVVSWFRKKDIMRRRGAGANYYFLCAETDIPVGVRLLCDIGDWHITNFHILIGSKDLPSKMYGMIDWWSEYPAIEERVSGHIIGAIDPLDNIFQFYGAAAVERITLSSLAKYPIERDV